MSIKLNNFDLTIELHEEEQQIKIKITTVDLQTSEKWETCFGLTSLTEKSPFRLQCENNEQLFELIREEYFQNQTMDSTPDALSLVKIEDGSLVFTMEVPLFRNFIKEEIVMEKVDQPDLNQKQVQKLFKLLQNAETERKQLGQGLRKQVQELMKQKKIIKDQKRLIEELEGITDQHTKILYEEERQTNIKKQLNEILSRQSAFEKEIVQLNITISNTQKSDHNIYERLTQLDRKQNSQEITLSEVAINLADFKKNDIENINTHIAEFSKQLNLITDVSNPDLVDKVCPLSQKIKMGENGKITIDGRETAEASLDHNVFNIESKFGIGTFGCLDENWFNMNTTANSGFQFEKTCQAKGEGFVSPADERLKDNIQNITNPINKLKQIRGVTFQWNTKYDPNLSKEIKHGVIAQEIQKVFPTMLSQVGKFYSVAYSELIPVLIEGVKQLNEEKEVLFANYEKQQQLVTELSQKIEVLSQN